MFDILLSIITKTYDAFFVITIVVTVFIAITLYFKQDLIFYMNYSSQENLYLPSRFNLPYESVYFEGDDRVKLHGWFISSSRTKIQNIEEFEQIPTIIYFSSNAGNMSHLLPSVSELYKHMGSSCNILLFNYRGYGESQGSPSELGITLDAEAALRYLRLQRNDVNPNNIVLYGRSLGAAVSIRLAARKHSAIRALIIENCFTSISDMIDVSVPYVQVYPIHHQFTLNMYCELFRAIRLFKFITTNHWDNKKFIRWMNSDVAVLFLSGQRDDAIPPSQMKLLYDYCPSAHKDLKLFPFGDHDQLAQQPKYHQIIVDFLKSYCIH